MRLFVLILPGVVLLAGPALAVPATAPSPPVSRGADRALRPPAEIEFAEPESPDQPPPALPTPWRDADWWLRGVAAWRADQPPPYLAPPQAPPPSTLLLAQGARAATVAAACHPDSALGARVRLWRLAATWLPPAVRPWLLARGRAEAYRAIKVREADLYRDTAFQEVLYTDAPAREEER